jgi:hypothetical protein
MVFPSGVMQPSFPVIGQVSIDDGNRALLRMAAGRARL